jgi:HlyD family secretion protein
MKQILSFLLGGALFAAVVWFGGQQLGWLPLDANGATPATQAGEPGTVAPAGDAATEQPAPNTPIQATTGVIADARVVPIQRAGLSVSSSGMVAEILVREGATVVAGQPLLRLNQAQAQAAVAKAEADLKRAQANLADLLAGTRLEDIAAAQATLDAAQARLDKLHKSTEAGDIAATEASVASANAQLQKVLEGASEDQLINAKADMMNAEAELQRAQRAYDQIRWRNDLGATKESADLQKATNNFEAARARYNDLLNGTSQADINSANAQIRQANAQLQALKAARPADIAASEAEVRNAQAQLDKLLAGNPATKIAAAEADVMAATASLQQQLIALGNTELRAPFAGVIAAVDIHPGEQANVGASLIQLADTSQWQIETEDLTELQVVQIQQGAEAALTFDALPDLELIGAVKSIRPFGENSSGDIVYTVLLDPNEQDPRLLWNMTAVVTFGAGQAAAADNAVAAVQR